MKSRKLACLCLFLALCTLTRAQTRSGYVATEDLVDSWLTLKADFQRFPDAADMQEALLQFRDRIDLYGSQPLFGLVSSWSPDAENDIAEIRKAVLRMADIARNSSDAEEMTALIDAVDTRITHVLRNEYTLAKAINRNYLKFLYIYLAISLIVILVAIFRRREVSSAERGEAYATAYAHSIITAHEDERKKLARELHDTVIQDMTGMKLRIEALHYTITKNTERYDEAFDALIGHERSCIERIRRVCYELRPPELDYLDLKAAVSELCSNFQDQTGIDCLFETTGDFALSGEKETNVFRIVQEALSNAAKHSGADMVRVLMTCPDERELTVSVRDNGVGFNTDRLKRPGEKQSMNFGLKGIKERVDILGGSLRIDSAPGAGTGISVTISLTA